MLAGLVGCNLTETNHKPKTDITRICFASGGCFGSCPVLALEIDSSLSYKYYGESFAKPRGCYAGKVTRSFWDSLTTKLEYIGYKNLDSAYNNSVDDIATATIIYYHGGKKHIYAQSESLPDSVWAVIEDIYRSYRQVKLTPVADTIEFERHMLPILLLTVPPPPPAPPPPVKEHDN